jgi:hypothetical protein
MWLLITAVTHVTIHVITCPMDDNRPTWFWQLTAQRKLATHIICISITIVWKIQFTLSGIVAPDGMIGHHNIW